MHIRQLEEIKIEAGAPLPIVLSSDTALWLLFYSDWDDHTAKDIKETIAIVQFQQFLLYKFGVPNDETLSGHPLYKLGLTRYSGHIVENSAWLKEVIKIDSVHPYHNKEKFEQYKHYILTFHDNTFECIAKAYEIQYTQQPFEEAAKAVLQRVIPI